MPDEKNSRKQTIDELQRLFAVSGDSQYGHEAVSQRQHALQSAALAEAAGASPSLIVAALLHDVGHLLHGLPDDAPEQGIDDQHEALAARWLARRFGPAVVEPVRLHVAAKRYLCTVEPEYRTTLSGPSETSLLLQGGPMTDEETAAFQQSPHADAAVALRRWDDRAKDPACVTPPLSHYLGAIEAADAPLMSNTSE